MEDSFYEKLDDKQRELVDAAEKVMGTAYNPYSNFFVGAALRASRDGAIIVGSNVENAAYGSTICAERAAILAANAQGYRAFDSLAIIARGADFDTTLPTAPCGSCRQNLYETSQIANKELEIILSNTNKDRITITSIRELLPLAFGPLDLGMDVSRFR